MLKMSFYNGTLNCEELKKFVRTTEKPIVYTYGYGWKNPTTHKKPVTVSEALEIIDREGFLDATETNEYLHLNAFSANDMW